MNVLEKFLKEKANREKSEKERQKVDNRFKRLVDRFLKDANVWEDEVGYDGLLDICMAMDLEYEEKELLSEYKYSAKRRLVRLLPRIEGYRLDVDRSIYFIDVETSNVDYYIEVIYFKNKSYNIIEKFIADKECLKNPKSPINDGLAEDFKTLVDKILHNGKIIEKENLVLIIADDLDEESKTLIKENTNVARSIMLSLLPNIEGYKISEENIHYLLLNNMASTYERIEIEYYKNT